MDEILSLKTQEAIFKSEDDRGRTLIDISRNDGQGNRNDPKLLVAGLNRFAKYPNEQPTTDNISISGKSCAALATDETNAIGTVDHISSKRNPSPLPNKYLGMNKNNQPTVRIGHSYCTSFISFNIILPALLIS